MATPLVPHDDKQRTSTLVDALSGLDADTEQAVWTGLARQLALEVLVGTGWTRLTRPTDRVVPRRQTARNYITRMNTYTTLLAP